MIDSVCLAVCGTLSTVFTSWSHLTAKDGSLGFCHFWGRPCSSLFLLPVECTLRSALRDVVRGKPVLLSVRCFPDRFLVARKLVISCAITVNCIEEPRQGIINIVATLYALALHTESHGLLGTQSQSMEFSQELQEFPSYWSVTDAQIWHGHMDMHTDMHVD